jgi:Domain of unknown function (DUF6265)
MNMLKRLAATCAIIFTGGVCTADTAGLDWMSGQWCTAPGDEATEEVWLPPRGDTLLGLSRTVTATDTVAFEYLRIVASEGLLNYIAQPDGRPPTSFREIARGSTWIRFENPAHDFPRRIEYRRQGEMLHAEITGPGEDGEEIVIAFDYRPCDR